MSMYSTLSVYQLMKLYCIDYYRISQASWKNKETRGCSRLKKMKCRHDLDLVLLSQGFLEDVFVHSLKGCYKLCLFSLG